MSEPSSRPVPVHHDPSVLMATAPNPGPKTLSGTHTYLVGRDPAFVIDPGPPDSAYQERLVAAIRGLVPPIRPAAILLSHGHPDHAPGARILKRMLEIEVVASAAMSAEDAVASGVDRRFGEDETFDLGDDHLWVVGAPGHTPDQVAFWLSRSHILFSGDTILGTGSTLVAPPDGDMVAYMKTLERMRALSPRLILPGHGPIISDPAAKIDEYMAHRQEREKQVLDALQHGPSTVEALADRIYTDTDPALHVLARGSVAAQLDKLVREGTVEASGDRYRLRP